MSTTTSNLGLFKYTEADYDQNFNFNLALNNNWDKIDLNCSPTYQNIETLSSGTLNLNANKVIYKITPSSSTTFTFSTTNLNLDSSLSYTFELHVNMSTVYSLTFPASVTWQDGTAPDLSTTGKYFLVFRTMDNGTTWYGNLQGVW